MIALTGRPSSKPLGEADLDIVGLEHESGEQRIRRRADQCGHPADVCRVGHRQQERRREPRLGGLDIALSVARNDRKRHRQHHHGRCRIADPHAQPRRRHDESTDLQILPCSDAVEHSQRDSPVQV